MRLLSYNIHSGIGSDLRYGLERTIAVIAEQNPDLICLQEVDSRVPRSDSDDQPALLARELKAAASFYQLNVPLGTGGYGNLVLSRWPLHSQHDIPLCCRGREPRAAQLMVVDTPEGPLHLVNWHLGLSETERRWQANQLLGHPLFLQLAHLPTLVAGDANDWLDTLHNHSFRPHHFQQATAPPDRFRSFPAVVALVSLDKVFYRGALDIQQALILRSHLACRASDHRPLVLDFRLCPQEPHPNGNGNGKQSDRRLRARGPFGWVSGIREAAQNFWAEVQAVRRGEPAGDTLTDE
jgi:endonuclease/exonuclease/phosphatase family metal-dependent hydrolase